jgi:colicin import membrane protein
MENRSLSLVAGLIALLAISFSALAADSEPSAEQQSDWQQRLDRAASMKAEAQARQAAAERLQEQKSAECFKKFLVNACQKEADHEHMLESREAKRLENQGKALEREVKKEQLNDKDKRRAEAAPQHEADLRARQAETAAAQQSIETEQAASRADKEKKAAEGAKRKAAEAEKQRKKQADHEARQAQKMQKAARHAAEDEQK